MDKYFFTFKNSVQNNLVYRANVFLMFFSEAISFGVLFYLWSSIYRQGGQIGTYAFQDIVFYYFAVNFVSLVVKGMDIAWQVGDEIRFGHLTRILLLPISYSKFKFSQFLGNCFFGGIVYSIVFSSVGFLLFGFLNFNFEVDRILPFFVSMGLGSLIYFLIFYFVGLSTFWFGLVRGLNFGAWMVISFLEGSFIPLDFLPSFIAKINDWLPFKYIMYVPVSIFTGRLDWQAEHLIVPIAWISVLYLLVKIAYKKGIKLYEGFGV